MPAFMLDTSCMVAAVCAWHEFHQQACAEIERRLEEGQKMIVAAPALVEAYAVLTRLPPPHRLRPKDAFKLLRENFIKGAKVAALSRRSYLTLIQWASENDVVGGRIYDGVIARCASAGRADALVTFNDSDFLSLRQEGLEIVRP